MDLSVDAKRFVRITASFQLQCGEENTNFVEVSSTCAGRIDQGLMVATCDSLKFKWSKIAAGRFAVTFEAKFGVWVWVLQENSTTGAMFRQ
ncbi:hypothetical protein F441_10732 [Phytophthora nicotianae CJ01A1]|uniref:Uncharacterized protein n=2 Tax=Phytophthora nicotianae TaxID=4792 RepID=W2IUS1_PHYNI|nr:hypothetical protein L915_10549 [Phytophthora nicotianae]ETL37919.1 hypothetical protein L916_10438 [Phytophthora nicotianae]ETL91037.1 hypothetical protein L917_10361 [Phytophthora nicotianae]ETP14320.1 hypothetical protein F441_10732 [Phytophthora nicotianae CJ01A1]